MKLDEAILCVIEHIPARIEGEPELTAQVFRCLVQVRDQLQALRRVLGLTLHEQMPQEQILRELQIQM